MALLLQSGHTRSYITHVCEGATLYLPQAGYRPSNRAAEATEHTEGILIEMLPGAATGQRTVMGIMAVMIEMAWQHLVCSE